MTHEIFGEKSMVFLEVAIYQLSFDESARPVSKGGNPGHHVDS